jgi:hypothetical protein
VNAPGNEHELPRRMRVELSARPRKPFYADQNPWVLGAGCIALALIMFFSNSPTEVGRLRSPNGDADAVLMRIPLGEFDHNYDYEVFVLAAGVRPPFGPPIMHGSSVAVRLDDPVSPPLGDLALRWTGPAQLTVKYGTASRIVVSRPLVQVGGETIAVTALSQVPDRTEAGLFVYPRRPQ